MSTDPSKASQTVGSGAVTKATAAPRNTRQRQAVGEVLATLDDFLSAQQLHELLSARGHSVGLTTVYRTVQSMAEAGEVDVVKRADGESVYRRCVSADHHHHLVCRICGRAVEVEEPTVESWAAAVAKKHGFTDVTHTVEIFGICPDH
jgi:Fur family ferric uptake transcriptional regulator